MTVFGLSYPPPVPSTVSSTPRARTPESTSFAGVVIKPYSPPSLGGDLRIVSSARNSSAETVVVAPGGPVPKLPVTLTPSISSFGQSSHQDDLSSSIASTVQSRPFSEAPSPVPVPPVQPVRNFYLSSTSELSSFPGSPVIQKQSPAPVMYLPSSRDSHNPSPVIQSPHQDPQPFTPPPPHVWHSTGRRPNAATVRTASPSTLSPSSSRTSSAAGTDRGPVPPSSSFPEAGFYNPPVFCDFPGKSPGQNRMPLPVPPPQPIGFPPGLSMGLGHGMSPMNVPPVTVPQPPRPISPPWYRPALDTPAPRNMAGPMLTPPTFNIPQQPFPYYSPMYAGPLNSRPSHRFYFEDGPVTVRVQDVLYKIHKHVLNASPVLAAETRSWQWNCGVTSHYNLTHRCESREFDLLLSIFYPRDFTQYEAQTVADWISILRLASLFSIENVRALAVKQLFPITSAVERIELANKYDIKDWLGPAYLDLCTRTQELTLEEGKKMGIEAVIGVTQLRSQLAANVDAYVKKL